MFLDVLAFFPGGLKPSSSPHLDLLEQLEPPLPISSSLLPNEGNPLGCGGFHPLFGMGTGAGFPRLGELDGVCLAIGRPPVEMKGFFGGDVF